MSRQRVIVTAGHVDHGKSSLVRALTGTDPDRLAEERRRGLTIELGFAWCELPTPAGETATVAAFVDVPGHERFIATMLAGAGPAPAALLVVAADDGWSAQTAEHVEVLDLLAIPAVAVALTKVDAVAADRVEEVERDIAVRLAGSTLEGAPVVRTAAPRGEGVGRLAEVLAARAAQLDPPADLGRPRLWVDRVFPVRGAGTVVTGTLGGGSLRLGDVARVLPGDREVRIRGIQSLGEDVEVAAPGTRVALNLAGVDRETIGRGDAIVGDGPWRATSRLDAVVRALPGRRVERAGAWSLHAGSASVPCRVAPVTGPVTAGEVGAVRLVLDASLPLVAGDHLVLREAGRRRTVAGGVVADPAPGPPPRGHAARERHAGHLRAVAAAPDPGGRLRALLALSGGTRPGAAALAAAGLPGDGPRPGGVVAVADHAVLTQAWASWADAIVAAADAPAHAGGVSREVLVAAARDAGAPESVASAGPDRVVADGRLVRTGAGFAAPGGAEAVVDEQRHRDDRLLDALLADPFSPPDLTETARGLGLDHREVNRLVQAGSVVRTGDLAFASAAIALAVDRLVALEAEVGPFTAAQAKRAWGTTRRYAIPLLEHLDRTRVTTFDGSLRTLTGRRPT
ncbi:MAG: selenocysteine-specific translation elongation factor [Nitriliruptor sp.]